MADQKGLAQGGQVLSQNTWTHRLARLFVRPLMNSAVTPNHLTTVRLVTGLAALGAFALGTPPADNWGGALFVLSAFLDRADGELARLSGQTSRLGHIYDLASDALVTALLFVAIGVGLRAGPLGSFAVVMGVVAGVAAALIVFLVTHLEARGETPIASAAGFDPDDTLYLVGPVAWLGALTPFLAAAFVGAPVVAVWLLWRHRALWLARG